VRRQAVPVDHRQALDLVVGHGADELVEAACAPIVTGFPWPISPAVVEVGSLPCPTTLMVTSRSACP